MDLVDRRRVEVVEQHAGVAPLVAGRRVVAVPDRPRNNGRRDKVNRRAKVRPRAKNGVARGRRKDRAPVDRLAARRLISAEWGASENNRKARYYELTAAGRRELRSQESTWRRYVVAVSKVLQPATEG